MRDAIISGAAYRGFETATCFTTGAELMRCAAMSSNIDATGLSIHGMTALQLRDRAKAMKWDDAVMDSFDHGRP